MDALTIRRAAPGDTEFLIEAICESDRSGTSILSYCGLFDLGLEEFEAVLRGVLAEDVAGHEFCLSGFLVAELDSVPVGACAGWVEGVGGAPSAILKSAVLFGSLPEHSVVAARRYQEPMKELAIVREPGAMQIEFVYVPETFRGRGIARKLIVGHIESMRSEADTPKAQVILSATNAAAKAVYLKAGFLPVMERWTSSQDLASILPSSGRLLMERSIS
ncbi:MAG: GNAT family N-acetyltransferase [Ignavibacteria bacterium]